MLWLYLAADLLVLGPQTCKASYIDDYGTRDMDTIHLAPTELSARLRTLLPETYQVFDESVQPRSMGSAGLKFGVDGKVLWGEMWASFCHLAMAGGPPHRGRLLEPSRVTPENTWAAEYQAVVAEICRGIGLVTGLCAEQAPTPGWVRMYCTSAAMCGWLTRAIVMENICVVSQGLSLLLPAGQDFRVEKEIKNVITSVAKTCHYWQDHMGDAQQNEIANLLASMERETPLVQIGLQSKAGPGEYLALAASVADTICRETGLQAFTQEYDNWVGVDCRTVAASIWLMRALSVCNVLARREENTVFFPLNMTSDPDGERTVCGFVRAYRLAEELQLFA